MTKKELIEFLEPYSDDTRIVYENFEYGGYEDIHPTKGVLIVYPTKHTEELTEEEVIVIN